jgi:hypothetical protein
MSESLVRDLGHSVNSLSNWFWVAAGTAETLMYASAPERVSGIGVSFVVACAALMILTKPDPAPLHADKDQTDGPKAP